MNVSGLLLHMKSFGKGIGWTTLYAKLLHGVTSNLMLSEGSAFVLT